jgi:predicted nucleotidyltransferase
MSTEEKRKKIQELAGQIAKNFQPEKIILFGSYAWGTPNPDSDVDILIIKDTDNPRKTAREIDGSIFPRPFPIDILVYKPGQIQSRVKLGDLFAQDIINNGKILYAR